MELKNLQPAAGSTKNRKRVGRGPASGTGKTAVVVTTDNFLALVAAKVLDLRVVKPHSHVVFLSSQVLEISTVLNMFL